MLRPDGCLHHLGLFGHVRDGVPRLVSGRLRPSSQLARYRSLQILFAVFHRVGDIALGTDNVDLLLLEMERSRPLSLAEDATGQPSLLDLLARFQPGDGQVG